METISENPFGHFCRLEQEQELQSSGAVSTQPDSELELANQRVRELELELAQTKLALVETECKNQDLVHQFNSLIQEQQVQNMSNTGNKNNTWYVGVRTFIFFTYKYVCSP